MKRTKNMNYRPTAESIELYMYADNNSRLYKRMIKPVIDNLAKKVERGIYETEKAADAFYYVMCEASKMYKKEFGYSFSVQDRFTAACDMRNYVESDYLNI